MTSITSIRREGIPTSPRTCLHIDISDSHDISEEGEDTDIEVYSYGALEGLLDCSEEESETDIGEESESESDTDEEFVAGPQSEIDQEL